MRDALYLTRAGDDPGSAVRILRQWSLTVALPVSVGGLGWVLEGIAPEQIGLCLDAAELRPVDRAAAVIEAALADVPRSASPVARDDLARVVGPEASVDLLIEDLAVDVEGRPYEVVQVGGGWMLRTTPAYARRSVLRRMWKGRP